MSLLAAIQQAVLRRHAPNVTQQAPDSTHTTPGVDVSSGSNNSRKKPKSAVQKLEELRQAPGSSPNQQLQALRGHFESCITQPSRYVEDQQLNRWMHGTRCAQREIGTHGQLLATWSKDLESDIRSVVTEAGLSASATSAVVDASKRGAIADNPGVLLCQIMALQSVLDRHVGKRAVGSILRAMPSVLNTSSDTIDWHYEELATMLGPDTAASLAVKAPFILCMAPFMVWSKLTFLQRLLGISIESAQAIVVRQPRLLCMAQAALETRLRELQSMARLGDKTLRQLVVKQPALLSYTSATLASNLDAMGRALGISDEQTSKMLARMPTLIMLSPSTVAAKLSAIQTLLKCTPEQAASLVTRQPFVLSVSSALLARKHEQVGQVLHTSPLDTSQVLCTNPTLLTLSTTTLAHKLTLLRESVLAAQGAEQEAHVAQQQVHAAQGAESPVTSLSRSTRSVAQQHTGSLPGAEQQAGRAQAAGSEQGLQLSAALSGEQGQQEQQQQQRERQPPSTLASPSSHGQETTHPGTHVQLQNALPVSAPVYDHTHALKPALPTDSITTTTTTTTTTLAQDPYPHMQVAAVAGSNHAHSTSTTAAAPCNLPPLHTSTTQGADAHPALTASSTTNPSMATSDPSKPLDTNSITDANAYLALTASSTANPSTATSALSAPPQRSEVTGADARSELTTSSTTNPSAATSVRSAPPQKSTATGVNAHPTLTTSSTTNPSLASAWLTQLEALTPQQRAALACFSKERFARLPQLAGARAAALGRRRVQHHQLQQQQAHAQHAPNLQQQHVCAQPAVLTPGAPAHPSSANARKKNVQDREPARKGPARKKDMDGVSEGAAAERRYTLAAVLRMTEAKFRTALALEQAGCSEP